MPGFLYEPDRENPGWHKWALADDTRFNNRVLGPLLIRKEGERSARLRMPALSSLHSNLHNNVHGGVTLALIDVALFGTARVILGGNVESSVTLDLTCQFISAGSIAKPLDAVTEVLRETRRLVFLRGLIMQDTTTVASYSGTIRKPTATQADHSA